MATIYDVAKAAGVSPKTVSRVINGDAPVGINTRAKVEKAIETLGFVPSLAARTMRSNKSGLVGMITGAISLAPDSSEFGGLPDLIIVQRVQKVLEDNGMSLLISDTGGKQERIPDLMRTFTEHRVEGMIFVADYHKKVALPDIPTGTKLVLANCYDDAGTPSVLPHDRLGQKMLVEALIAKGHRRIAYLSLSNDIDATRLRTAGYRDALESAGLAFDPALVIPADTRMSDPQAEAPTALGRHPAHLWRTGAPDGDLLRQRPHCHAGLWHFAHTRHSGARRHFGGRVRQSSSDSRDAFPAAHHS